MRLLPVRARPAGIIAAAILSACSPVARGQQEPAPPLPDDVVAAWGKAGGGHACVSIRDGYHVVALIDARGIATPPEPGELPGFSFGAWERGITGKLPHPQTPFGLLLGRFTDDDVKDLAGLKNLRALVLGGKRITDADLPALYRLEGLRDLNLRGARRVTDAGVEELRKALPGLRIDRRKYPSFRGPGKPTED